MPRGASPGQPAPGEPTTERVRGIFSGIARRYDLFNHVASLGIDRLWRRAAVKAARLDGRSRALDLCAGTGDLTLALARAGRPAEVVGSDFTPEMLDIAREKAKRYEGGTRVRFELADAQDLPFEDAAFDAVTVAFGVRNLPDRQANFREVVRVLKPGGRYVVLEFSRPNNPLVRALYHFYLGRVVPNIGALLSGDKASFTYLDHSIRAFPTQKELAEELRAAGFSEVTWRNLSLGVVAVHVAVK